MSNTRDVASGAIVACTGAFFAVSGWWTLPVGTAFRMGPGFFPVSIGILVVALGATILVGGLRQDGTPSLPPVRIRPLVLIPAAILSFLFTVRGAGLLPAIFLVVVVARAADPESRPLGTIVLALAMCAICAAIFIYGLGLPLPLLGSWWQGF